MQGLLKYNYATADATGVAHDNIDAILTGNKLAQAYNLEEASNLGTIGPNPAYDDEGNFKFKGGYLGENTIFSPLDLLGLGAMGRIGKGISKAALTGGETIMKGGKQLGTTHKAGKTMPPEALDKLLGIMNKLKGTDLPSAKSPLTSKSIQGQMEWDNLINKSKILYNKAMEKWGIRAPLERQMMDPVSETLRRSKYKRN